MKQTRTLLGMMAMAFIMLFASIQSANAQSVTSHEVDDMCSKLNTLIPAIRKASTADEVTLLTKQFDSITKKYEQSTEALTSGSRKRLSSTYLNILNEMTRASIRFQGINPDTPSVKERIEQGMRAINEFVRNTAEKSATLGDFLSALEQM